MLDRPVDLRQVKPADVVHATNALVGRGILDARNSALVDKVRCLFGADGATVTSAELDPPQARCCDEVVAAAASHWLSFKALAMEGMHQVDTSMQSA